MQENTYTNKYNKIGKKLLKILIIFLVILFVLLAFFYVYKTMQNDDDYKNEFLTYFYKNDLKFFHENENFENMIEKIQNSNYKLSTKVKMDSTMENNMFSDFELSNFEFNINLVSNYNNAKKIDLNIKYSENNLINLGVIINKNQCAIKLDEISDKYLGCEKENLQKIININQNETIDLSNFSEIKDFISKRENYKLSEFFQISSLKDLKNIVNQSFENGVYSARENIIIDQNNEKKEAIEYELKLDANQFNELLMNIYDTIDEENEIVKFFAAQNLDDEDVEDEVLIYKDNDEKIVIPIEEQTQYATEYVTFDRTNSNNTVNNFISNDIINNVNNINNINNSNNNINNITNITNMITTDTVTNVNQVENIFNNVENPIVEVNSSENVIENVSEIEEEENLRLKGFFYTNDDSVVNYSEDDGEFLIGEDYEETIENIEIMSGKINWLTYLLTGSKINLTEYEFAEKIKETLNSKIKQKNSLDLKIYVSNDKTIKYVFEMPESKETISIEIIDESDNGKYLSISFLTGEESEINGKCINIYKKDLTARKTYNININKVTNGNISKKTKVNIELIGSTKDTKNDIVFDLTHTDINGTFKIETNNTVYFDKDSTVELLNDENCIFLDQMPDEELVTKKEEISGKIKNMLSEKNRNLNIINLNSLENIIKHDENTNFNVESQNEIRQVLIQYISQRIEECENNGCTFELENLENMQIDGYNVQVSISSNVAVINIDGYAFNLDSELNLSDG